ATLGALQAKDAATGALKPVDPADALAFQESWAQAFLHRTAEALGAERKTFVGEVFQALDRHRLALWRAQLKEKINWELFDVGMETYTEFALEELAKEARSRENGAQAADDWRPLGAAPHGADCARFAEAAVQMQLGKPHDRKDLEPFAALREELRKPFAARVVSLWPRESKSDGDLVRDEMERV